MHNIYKVTAANIKKTQKGHELYNLQFNNSFWATKLVPLSEIDQRWEPLYKLYSRNNKSLNFLVGRHISIDLQNSKFGMNFNNIVSFDALQDFKELLDKSNGKAFLTKMNVFGFLTEKGHTINSDGTITLREPYSTFDIAPEGERTICYPNKPEAKTLTINNIRLVYNEFFKDKYIDNGNPDRDEQYALTPVAIIKTRRIFHKSKSEVISDDVFDVLRIGESLSEEQFHFLSGAQPIGEK